MAEITIVKLLFRMFCVSVYWDAIQNVFLTMDHGLKKERKV